MLPFPVVTSFWNPGPPPDAVPLGDDREVDVAVVGAGFAGLSSAYAVRTADPSLSVALVESEYVGFGASGRCLGALAPMHPGLMFGTFARAHSPRVAAETAGYLLRELAAWRARLRRGGVDCEDRDCRVLLAAHSAAERNLLRRCAGHLQDARVRFERVGGDEVRALVPFAVSEGMVLSDGFATVDPYKLARGLRRLLLESGVAVYEHSKVAALRPGMAGVELEMQSGPRLRARKVVLATSLYTSRLAGIGRGTGLGGAYTYVVATEPLDDDTLASLGPALHCGVVAEARIKYAYARTHQRRLLLGGRTRLVRTVDATAESDERAYRSLYSELQRRFPFLAGVRVAAGWSGPVHIATMARMPIVRPAASDPRVILNVGYNVDGMSLALLSGKMVANLVVGERPLDAEAEGVRQVYLTTRMGLRECLQMAPWLLRN